MTNMEINPVSRVSATVPIFFRLLRMIVPKVRPRSALGMGSMPDYLRRDIGLPPAGIAVDREISMANVNIRAGVIFHGHAERHKDLVPMRMRGMRAGQRVQCGRSTYARCRLRTDREAADELVHRNQRFRELYIEKHERHEKGVGRLR